MRTSLLCLAPSATPRLNMKHAMVRSSLRRRHRSGFTLIEVAVALVIFVIGALAIMRIFPPALGLVQGSESRAIATRLDRSTLSILADNPGQVPDAIIDAAYGSGAWTWNDATTQGSKLPIAVVGTTSLNHSIPSDIIASSFTDSSLAHFRHIVRETHTVQKDSNGKLFILTKSPYGYGSPLPSSSAVQVFREDQVNGVVINQSDELDFTSARLASTGAVFNDLTGPATDPKRPPDSMRAPNNVIYYVSYQWREDLINSGTSTKRLQSVIDEPLSLPPDAAFTAGSEAKVFQTTRVQSKVAQGAVAVRFRQLIGSVTYNPATATDVSNGRVGYVPLIPSGSNSFGALSVGDTVTLDYDVEDWRQLLDDGTPNLPAPLATPSYPVALVNNVTAVNLPIRNLDDTQPTWVHSLLMDTSNPQSIVLNQAEWNSSSTPAGASGAGSNPNPSSLVDVYTKAGRVVYNVNGVNAPRARTGYRTLDTWAHQLSVAARSYLPYYSTAPYFDATTSPYSFDEKWREYEVLRPDGQLLFHSSEAGKSIMVSYEYLDSTTTPATYRQVVGSIITINDRPAPSPDTTFTPYSVAVAQLTDVNGNDLNGGQLTAITNVQGVDIRARTAYIDNAHYTQASVVAYRSTGSL